MIATEEVIGLVDHIRRNYGSTLPAAPVRESHKDRDRRQEETKWILENTVLQKVNEERVSQRERRLSEDDEDRIVESVLSSMFLLPHLLGILEREPLGEDVIALGNSQCRRPQGAKARPHRASATHTQVPTNANDNVPMWHASDKGPDGDRRNTPPDPRWERCRRVPGTRDDWGH